MAAFLSRSFVALALLFSLAANALPDNYGHGGPPGPALGANEPPRSIHVERKRSDVPGEADKHGRGINFGQTGDMMEGVKHHRDVRLQSRRSVSSYPPSRRSVAPAWPYGSDKVRGVNLGGWLVLEPWITPSLFQNTGDNRIVDEWTLGQYLGYDKALSMLKSHWDSWITEADFAQIASYGLNHVRVPIGYWAFDVSHGEPFVKANQMSYLINAANWAKQHGLKMLIDLHGAPGSQNGYDNSGRKGTPEWFNNQTNHDRAKGAIQSLVSEFGKSEYAGTVTAIELLNEPAGYLGSPEMSFYESYAQDAYYTVRYPFASSGNGAQSDLLVVIHDAFENDSTYDNFMTEPNFSAVALDTHLYQVFTDAENAYTAQQHINEACGYRNALVEANNHHWTIVGEWSTATTDCAKWLNGRFIGSRYDGSYPSSTGKGDCSKRTGSASNFSDAYKTTLRQFFEAQIDTYEAASGWIYWTWKNEDAAEWSYQAGVQGGWIPSNPTDRMYPNICG